MQNRWRVGIGSRGEIYTDVLTDDLYEAIKNGLKILVKNDSFPDSYLYVHHGEMRGVIGLLKVSSRAGDLPSIVWAVRNPDDKSMNEVREDLARLKARYRIVY